ncbi:MAG: hypothetical protein PVH28_13245 [Desulfobacterales bacterium]
MIMPGSKSILKWMFFLLWLLCFTGIHFICISCSAGYRETMDKTEKTVAKTTRKFTRKIRFSDDDLQRLAAVVGFENKSLYRSQDFTHLFRKGIPEYLNNECDDVTVANFDNGEDVKSLKELPMLPSGQIDNFALAVIGRQLGLNAIVTGCLDDIGLLNELRGMVWKDTHHLIQILVSVEVYDTETGAKILAESFSRKVEIEELDYDLMQSEGKMILPDMNETLSDLINEMGETICWAIEDQPWNGFIIAVDGDKIILSAGSRSGLEPGDEFEVFDTSRILEGRNGQRFFYHGQKTGEVKIVEVEPDKATAIIVSDKGIKTGNSLRVK